MKRVRLLPIVIVAASGLLILKGTELVTTGGRLFAESEAPKKVMRAEDLPPFARALARHRFVPPVDADITGSIPAKKDESKKDEKPDPATQRVAEQRPTQPLPPPAPTSASERAVLERLQERRGAIDDRSRELDMRESLLQAAERKVDGRINELKEVEGRLDAGAKAEQAEVDKQMRTVVVMYEAMKPKDAARVFDRLKLDVLVPIATAMKPARMSEIMAAMTPEAAEKLTVALASKPREGPSSSGVQGASGGTPAGELPRIDQQPQQRPRR